MRTASIIRGLALGLLLAAPMLAHAYDLRVQGVVTGHADREPMGEVLVRLYRNGVLQEKHITGPGGRYSFLLEAQGEYVVRFSKPGLVTKCFAVDARGAVWEGDRRVKHVEVEMTMLERIPGVDLSFFDMPMGMARFDPMTGLLRWNKDYEDFVRPRVEDLLAQYERRRSELAVISAAPGRQERGRN